MIGAICRYALWAIAAGGALLPGQVLDGSRNPHAFSDREALGVLFTLVRSSQPGGWDIALRHQYLLGLGLTRSEAFQLIQAADAWFGAIAPIDAELRQLREAARGRPLGPGARQQADSLAARKLTLLEESLHSIRLKFGMEGTVRLDQSLLAVKRGMKAYVAGTPPGKIRHKDHEKP